MKKRLFLVMTMLVAVMMVLLLPVSGELQEETRYCKGCDAQIGLSQWTALGGEVTETLTLTAGKHYYLTADITDATEDTALLSGAGCLDLNGFNITADSQSIALRCAAGTTNVMGEGTISGTYTSDTVSAATVLMETGAVVNLYGGTFTKVGTNNPAFYLGENAKLHMYDGAHMNCVGTFTTYPTAVYMINSGSLFHMHGGTITGGETTGNGGAVRVSAGSMIMDGGTIYAGTASRGGGIAINKDGGTSSLTINGGTITGGTATQTNGGGNVYTNYRTVTINGGNITNGTAAGSSYGGGNLGSRLGTFVINDGNISGGTVDSTDEDSCGGNIYISGGGLVINGGTISGGTAKQGGSIAIVKSSTLEVNGGTVTGGTANAAYGGGNIYVHQSTGTINGGLITLGTTNGTAVGGGNLTVLRSQVEMYGGTVSYGSCYGSNLLGGGNIYVGHETAVFDMHAGLVERGYLGTSGAMGYHIYAHTGTMRFGEGAQVINKGESSKGSYGIYMRNGDVEFAGVSGGALTIAEGNAYVTGGKIYSFHYYGTGTCEISGGRFRSKYTSYTAPDHRWVQVASTGNYIYTVAPNDQLPGVSLVASDGTETYTFEPIALFDAATHSYVRLNTDINIGTMSGQTLPVDLNGHDMTVAGNGTLEAFDSANDTYDATACGSITNNGEVEILSDHWATNGYRYVALTENNVTTLHRLDLYLSAIYLRTSSVGIFYESVYHCDDALAEKVDKYGVVLSINDMPGADFMTATEDINLYSVIPTEFTRGVSVTSCSVFGIMKEDQSEETNAENGDTVIYANPYILFDSGTVCVGDTENPGKKKTDDDFTGHGYSLHDVMDALDRIYLEYPEETRERVNDFYATWKDRGMDWDFVNIANPDPQPEPEQPEDVLELVDGMALCTVCNKTVTWTPMTQEANGTTAYGNAANGAHLYLAEDITYTGSSNPFLTGPKSSTTAVACFHLNGHTLTATKFRAILGATGTLNVMGDGTVIGYAASSNGGAVQINTSSSRGKVNLYGGTYRLTENSSSNGGVVAVLTTGGAINVYENARLEAGGIGYAARAGKNVSYNSAINLYGAYVEGNLYLTGANPQNGKINKLTVDGATIDGTIDANGASEIILKGSPGITLLDLDEDAEVKLQDMSTDIRIPLKTEGRFCAEGTADYAACFTPADSHSRVTEKDGALWCGTDYTATENYCPVCGKSVVWQSLNSAADQITLTAGQHLQLTDSLTWQGSEAFILATQNACVDMNGYSITAPNGDVFGCTGGTLNVMGNGSAGTVSLNGTATVNLCSGSFQAVTVGQNGGTLNVYADARVSGNAQMTAATVNLYGTIDGDINTAATTTLTVQDGTVNGKFTVASDAAVTLRGRPKIANMQVAEGTLITPQMLQPGTYVAVEAQTVFTAPLSAANLDNWLPYFTAVETGDWITDDDLALSCRVWKTLPNGGKIIVLGNSMTYYGKYVIDQGQSSTLADRQDDRGYLYQVCKANHLDVSVTNFTYGNHRMRDFYSGSCAADRGHNGRNHLEEDLTDRYYDYVIIQEGNEAHAVENLYEEIKPMMDIFLEANPNTKFVVMLQYTIYSEDTAWLSTVKELEEHGIIVVDWGALVYDLINGTVTPPDAQETYSKFSLIVNKTSVDGRHPNILAGYIAAQMTYCAITGESAVGKDYSFWNDTNANSAFKLSTYVATYYGYDSTSPSNSNFQTIFNTPSEMTALQKLIDQYLEEKGYRYY